MYNLENHGAYESIKLIRAIPEIVRDLFTEKNFQYDHFNKKINEFAEGVAGKLYPNNTQLYSTRKFSSKEELESKIKGDIFEIFVMFFLQYFEKMPNILGIKEGTYTQIADEDDVGMDFYGIKYSSGKNERVFGQIKYRNPALNILEEHKAFNREVIAKLAGEATITMDFDKNKEYLLFVTNREIDDSIHYKAKEKIGFVNGSTDSKYSYIKFVDATIFRNMLGYNEATFWNEFANQFN